MHQHITRPAANHASGPAERGPFAARLDDPRNRAAVVAALRLLQHSLDTAGAHALHPVIDSLRSDGWTLAPLDADGLDDLVAALDGNAPRPTAYPAAAQARGPFFLTILYPGQTTPRVATCDHLDTLRALGRALAAHDTIPPNLLITDTAGRLLATMHGQDTDWTTTTP